MKFLQDRSTISWLAIMILIVIGVAFSTLDLLVTPALLSYTQAQEWSPWIFGIMTWMPIIAIIVASQLHSWLVARWGLRTVLLSTTIGWLLCSCLRVISIYSENMILFIVMVALATGFGAWANLSLSLQLQEELKGYQMIGMAIRIVLASVFAAWFASLALGAPQFILKWATYHAWGLLFCVIVTLFIWRRLMDEVPSEIQSSVTKLKWENFKKRFRQWFERDYVRIYLPQVFFLFVVIAALPLFPILERGSGDAPAPLAGQIAAFANGAMVAQLIFSFIMYYIPKTSTFIMISMRVLSFLSFPLIIWGIVIKDLWIVTVAALLWGISNCNRPISRAVVRERNYRLEHDLKYRAKANALPNLLWQVVGAFVPLYYLLFDLTSSKGAEMALWWMMLPLLITAILTIIVRKSYLIPLTQQDFERRWNFFRKS